MVTELEAMREYRRKEELHRKKLLRLSNQQVENLFKKELKKKRERLLKEHFGEKELKPDEEKKFFNQMKDLKPEKNSKISEFI